MSRLRFDSRSGLTLLELVIVLGILAALSTIAVRSLEPIADQARYEHTQMVLNDLRCSILGTQDNNLRSQTKLASGFLLDTGSLPSSLNSLLVRPGGLIDRTLQSFDSDRDSVDDVSLSSGWNGPYLSLGAGVSVVVDGWGAEPTLVASSGNLTILSLGSDGNSSAPEDGYKKDVSINILASEYQGSLVFRLFDIDTLTGSRIDPSPIGTQQLGVLFYGVNATGGATGAIAEQMLIVSNAGSFEYRRNNTLCGQIAARAILWNDLDSDDVLDAGEVIIKKSFVHSLQVPPRIDTRIEMELR